MIMAGGSILFINQDANYAVLYLSNYEISNDIKMITLICTLLMKLVAITFLKQAIFAQ